MSLALSRQNKKLYFITTSCEHKSNNINMAQVNINNNPTGGFQSTMKATGTGGFLGSAPRKSNPTPSKQGNQTVLNGSGGAGVVGNAIIGDANLGNGLFSLNSSMVN
jgi:hypothetical protein